MRADAQRNRAKVLAAAETVFADMGTAASTEEIARRAGVGIGTVFRHFPTKEALLEAVLLNLLDRLAEQAEELAATGDAGAAFFTFFARIVDQAATKNAVSDALAEAGVDAKATGRESGRRMRKGLVALLDRAQRAGAVRKDVGLAEVGTLLVGAARAAEQAGADPGVRARTLEVIFDGLRAR